VLLLRFSYKPLETCELKVEAFENVRDQVGFCGIWCGSCAAGNGAIVELARRFDKIVKDYELEKWGPKDFDFNEFMKGLTSIQAMGLCPGCRKGGGPPTCSVKICASKKGIADCSQCNQLTECKQFEWLEKNHPTIKEDLKKNKNKSRKELINKWTSEIETKWPHCILLCTPTKK